MDFIKPVLLACMLACVGAYFIINRYFQQFSSRVEISAVLYVAVTIFVTSIAIFTVVALCYRAANADPVKTLRYE